MGCNAGKQFDSRIPVKTRPLHDYPLGRGKRLPVGGFFSHVESAGVLHSYSGDDALALLEYGFKIALDRRWQTNEFLGTVKLRYCLGLCSVQPVEQLGGARIPARIAVSGQRCQGGSAQYSDR